MDFFLFFAVAAAFRNEIQAMILKNWGGAYRANQRLIIQSLEHHPKRSFLVSAEP